jgi:leucine dehydrogenase
MRRLEQEEMNILEQLSEHDYERVVFCNDNDSGLKAIIAIHDTTLGPALGGVRMRAFTREEDALEDVLRLSRAMTYKASIAGVDLGGGKSVILGDPYTDKSEALLKAMGRAIDGLGGVYIAGQDIGTNSDDMAILRGQSSHVSCLRSTASDAGDTSETTAYGAVAGIRAVLKTVTGNDELSGRRIGVQGVGNTGFHVARHCLEAGASVFVADVDTERLARASQLGAEVMPTDAIHKIECDVFSPCSIGAVINDTTLPELRCAGIAGTANNVLAQPHHADQLMERDILYAPDYLVNSGGLIRCEAEVKGQIDEQKLRSRVGQIYQQTLEVFEVAAREGVSPAVAADRVAEARISQAREQASSPAPQ